MELPLTDYDPQITEIILSHYHIILPSTGIDCYSRGRPFHGLIYAVEGCAEYRFPDGSRLYISQGDAALLPAKLSYRMRCFSDTPFAHYTVNFQGQYDTFPQWIPRTQPYVFHPISPASAESGFQQLNQTWQQRNLGYRLNTRIRLLTLLAELLDETAYPNLFPNTYPQIKPALRRIHQDYAKTLTLEDLAGECHLSIATFRRLFKELYHQSPISYLLNIRIDKAKELLLLGCSLEETALSTGFSDSNYFIRYFRQKTGMTPKAYQLQNTK